MSALATLFGSYTAARRIFGQADVLTDVLKTAVIIAVGTAMLSFFFWTLTHLKKASPARGAVAGLLSALCVIPLPVFAWKLKTELLAAYTRDPSHLLGTFFETVPSAIGTGLLTYQTVTKASLIAVVLSSALGYAVSRWHLPAGTSRRRP
ncbi:hypothetical protein GCM10009069_06170 [Algimonas arctica]|uniref:Uncharacterized protein n=1 Tax=Algimonas arctica TaxID=1479486 RepID=A0A8J3CMM4_9PROT|nr:hypothetical protein GCM10009069_06170 [Algimonas arctica]